MTKDEAITYLIEAGQSGGQYVNVPRDVLLALDDKPNEKADDDGQPAKESDDVPR